MTHPRREGVRFLPIVKRPSQYFGSGVMRTSHQGGESHEGRRRHHRPLLGLGRRHRRGACRRPSVLPRAGSPDHRAHPKIRDFECVFLTLGGGGGGGGAQQETVGLQTRAGERARVYVRIQLQREQKILGLEVAMDETPRVAMAHAAQKLEKEPARRALLAPAPQLYPIEQLPSPVCRLR